MMDHDEAVDDVDRIVVGVDEYLAPALLPIASGNLSGIPTFSSTT